MATFRSGDFVEARFGKRLYYGIVRYNHGYLVVADWYGNPERRGIVFQQGVPAETVEYSKGKQS